MILAPPESLVTPDLLLKAMARAADDCPYDPTTPEGAAWLTLLRHEARTVRLRYLEMLRRDARTANTRADAWEAMKL